MRSLAWAAVVAAVVTGCAKSAEHGETGVGGESTGGAATGGGSSTSGSTTSGTTSGGTTTSSASTSGSTSTGSTSSGGTSSLTITVTPNTSIIGQMVSAIEGATQSVHMTMYILDNSQIVSALVAAKQAGKDVRVVMNQTFPTGTVQTNPATYTTLTNAGVGVVWRNGPPNATSGAYTHEKTFILDGKTAWIMTMNLDTSAPKYNREYIAVDTDPADVAEADAIFLADFAGTNTTAGAPLVVAPNNARTDLVSLINSAMKTLDVEGEEFSDTYSTGVTNAVAAAAKRGVATRVIVANDSFTTNMSSSIATVKAAGAHVVMSGGTSGGSTASNPYIHAKAITVDCTGTTCARGYIGSENFSGGSLGYNRELGLIVDNATELAKVQTAINADFAAGTAQ